MVGFDDSKSCLILIFFLISPVQIQVHESVHCSPSIQMPSCKALQMPQAAKHFYSISILYFDGEIEEHFKKPTHL